VERGTELICVFEFNGDERTVTTVLSLGELRRLSLPAPITWPDGSQSDTLEILISQKTPDEVDCGPSASAEVGLPQAAVDSPRS